MYKVAQPYNSSTWKFEVEGSEGQSYMQLWSQMVWVSMSYLCSSAGTGKSSFKLWHLCKTHSACTLFKIQNPEKLSSLWLVELPNSSSVLLATLYLGGGECGIDVDLAFICKILSLPHKL